MSKKKKVEINGNTVTFKGYCKGVRLEQRGENDKHIVVKLLTEDDGNWFETAHVGSSYWIDELIAKLNDAKEYMKNNCEPDIHDNRQYGYKFKKL